MIKKSTQKTQHLNTQKGFSLIELSIAALVVGFLVLVTIASIQLINHSHINNTITTINQHENAVHNFKLKYNAIPGDFRNAFSLWGTQCASNASSCNGDGNGHLTSLGYFAPEDLKMWKHLQLAGLINGNYTGSNPTGTYRIGIDVPRVKLREGGIYAVYDSHYGYLGKNTDFFVYGTQVTGTFNYGALLKPNEIHYIDKKIDDGLPSSGLIMGSTSGANAGPGTCSNGSGAESFFNATSYNLTNTNVVCRMLVAKITNTYE